MTEVMIPINGEVMKRGRDSMGLSQSKIAQMLNVNPGIISFAERGMGKLSQDNTKKLANILNMPMAELVDLNNKNFSEKVVYSEKDIPKDYVRFGALNSKLSEKYNVKKQTISNYRITFKRSRRKYYFTNAIKLQVSSHSSLIYVSEDFSEEFEEFLINSENIKNKHNIEDEQIELGIPEYTKSIEYVDDKKINKNEITLEYIEFLKSENLRLKETIKALIGE